MSTVAEANIAPATQTWSAWRIDPRHSLAQFSVRHKGFVGLPIFLGGGSIPGRAFCQIPGEAMRM